MRDSRTHRLLPALLALVFLASLPAVAGEGKTYGEPLTGSDTVAISELLSDPDSWVGKTVRVEGTVTGVCEKRGCWISLASDREFEELRIKAKDGVIVFPIESKGHRAVAEGVFTKMELTLEQTIARAKHHAEEHGEPYDPDEITEPLTLFQINVTGAVIH